MLAVFAGRRRFVRCSRRRPAVLGSNSRTSCRQASKPLCDSTFCRLVIATPDTCIASKEQGRCVAKSLVHSTE
eukprot:634325-Amphidinium_carterae.1